MPRPEAESAPPKHARGAVSSSGPGVPSTNAAPRNATSSRAAPMGAGSRGLRPSIQQGTLLATARRAKPKGGCAPLNPRRPEPPPRRPAVFQREAVGPGGSTFARQVGQFLIGACSGCCPDGVLPRNLHDAGAAPRRGFNKGVLNMQRLNFARFALAILTVAGAAHAQARCSQTVSRATCRSGRPPGGGTGHRQRSSAQPSTLRSPADSTWRGMESRTVNSVARSGTILR